MKNTLPDLSGKIDETSIAALTGIKKAATGLNFSFFVVGTMQDVTPAPTYSDQISLTKKARFRILPS